jgi:hypothetical protein
MTRGSEVVCLRRDDSTRLTLEDSRAMVQTNRAGVITAAAAVTKVASTEAAMNREGIKEAKWFRDAFVEHRERHGRHLLQPMS